MWTAPSSDHLRQDIVLAKKLGFNGARLHQKVFEPLYFAHADELGFLVFCESPGFAADLVLKKEFKHLYILVLEPPKLGEISDGRGVFSYKIY